MFRKSDIAGWGGFPRAVCEIYRPEKSHTLSSLLPSLSQWVARGSGLSYGDASLQPKGTIYSRRLNTIEHFDSIAGTITVHAGVTLQEVLDVVIPKGWLPPVMPGTQFVTIGGCVAANVHGKNHFAIGGFAEHVTQLMLRLASGELVECSPHHNREYFEATCGGMGMTGFIEKVTLKLVPIKSHFMQTLSCKYKDFDGVYGALATHDQCHYQVIWVNHFSSSLGGIFYGASISEEAHEWSHQKEYYLPSLPVYQYGLPLAVRMMNQMRLARCSSKDKPEVQDMRGFLFPLDRLRNWNVAYGKSGLIQYQCILPDTAEVAKQIKSLLHFLQECHCYAYLAVIKRHSKDNVLLPFGQAGVSLALDFPNSFRVRQILAMLNDKVVEYHGRVYLAKDSLTSQEVFEAMYGKDLKKWKKIVKELDPKAHIQSLLSERLGLKDYV